MCVYICFAASEKFGNKTWEILHLTKKKQLILGIDHTVFMRVVFFEASISAETAFESTFFLLDLENSIICAGDTYLWTLKMWLRPVNIHVWIMVWDTQSNLTQKQAILANLSMTMFIFHTAYTPPTHLTATLLLTSPAPLLFSQACKVFRSKGGCPRKREWVEGRIMPWGKQMYA